MITTNIRNLDAKGQITGKIEPSYGFSDPFKRLKVGWDEHSNIDIPVKIKSYNEDGTVNCTVDLNVASPQQQAAYALKQYFNMRNKLFNNML